MRGSRVRRAVRPCGAITVVACCGVLCASAHAQETRETLIASQQAERAANLTPGGPNGLERVFQVVEHEGLPERILRGLGGFYPRFGGLSPAGGFAMGAGFRRHLRGGATFETGFTMSPSGYRLADAQLAASPVGDALGLTGSVTYRDYPRERYFGIGGGSSRSDRTHFGLRDVQLDAGVTVRPAGPLRLSASIGYLDPRIEPGEGAFPSIDERFTDAEAPGLAAQPDFLTWQAGASVDLRDVPANARAGGLYSILVTGYEDRELGRYSFRRYVLEGIQYLPFFDTRRAFVVRARGVLTDASADQRVPFYLMPTLGGPETLRGFREYRFRDRNMLLLTAEYRWEVFAALDMALFVDGGSFAPRPSSLSLGELDASYGVGFRFSSRPKFVFRTDIGFSREGTRVFARFIPVF